jgi:hypothetical protein
VPSYSLRRQSVADRLSERIQIICPTGAADRHASDPRQEQIFCGQRPRPQICPTPSSETEYRKSGVTKGPQMGLFLAKSQRPPNRWTAWWAREDSNLQPDRYERPALTIELRALASAAERPWPRRCPPSHTMPRRRRQCAARRPAGPNQVRHAPSWKARTLTVAAGTQ